MEMLRHVEQTSEQLNTRMCELQASLEIPHNIKRRKELNHILSCVAFELHMRELENCPLVEV